MAATEQSLSCRLYNAMEEIGASEAMRLIAKETATAVEIILSILFGLSEADGCVCVCGSRFEGSAVFDTLSDTDIIFGIGSLTVKLEQNNLNLHDSQLFLIRDEYTHPGYVKLQDVDIGQPLTITTLLGQVREQAFTLLDMLHFIRNNRDVDCMGRICLKPIPVEEKHGPASKVVNERGVHIFDTVAAVPCQRIPDFAKEWIKRRRRFEWPTDKQVRDMSDLGCFVVGVGHECSAEKDMEWRLSFTRQERILMASLNPTQHKVYILLKMIKKEHLKPFFEDKLITSYHLKTLVLHTVANSPVVVWTKDNIVNCIMHCLHILCSWVRNGFCPNYFMKENNLFSKSLLKHTKNTLLSKLKELLRLKQSILFSLNTGGIGAMLTNVGRVSGHTMTKMKAGLQKILFLSPISYFLLGFEELDEKVQHARGAPLLKYLQSTRTVSGYTETETSLAFSYILPWAYLHVAKQLASDSLQNANEVGGYRLIRKAFKHFRKASPTDMVQVHLAKASYYFMKRRFRECLTLLNKVEGNMIKTSTVSTCCCSDGNIHVNDNKSLASIVTMPREEIAARIASCVIFLPSHKRLVPLPLRQEMKRGMYRSDCAETLFQQMLKEVFECAVVDAMVYLYFLKYLVSKELNKPYQTRLAITNLHRIILKRNISHGETAYNLLGWIYIQENRVGESVHCFMESWRIRPNRNAARIHMNGLSEIFCRIIRHWKKSWE